MLTLISTMTTLTRKMFRTKKGNQFINLTRFKSVSAFVVLGLTISGITLSSCKKKSSDEPSTVTIPAETSKVVGPTPGAVFTLAEDVKFDTIIPNDVLFGTIIGDRSKGAHGTFVRIRKGAATPAHTHGKSYHAVIIKGSVQNPFAGYPSTNTKMGPGSYYYVPAKSEHVTKCADDSPTECMTFFYQDDAFDFTPNPAGVDTSLGQGAVIILEKDVKFDVILPGIADFGTVYGDRETGPHGTFVKIKKGTGTPKHVHTTEYHAVILEGIVENPIPSDQTMPKQLGPGSHYFVPAGAEHITRCASNSPTDCKTYFYQTSKFDFIAK